MKTASVTAITPPSSPAELLSTTLLAPTSPISNSPVHNSDAPLVLIIEDNDKNRKLVRDVLQFKGYGTLEAETAEEGILLAQVKSPALILMDIQLPGIDGIEAFHRLRGEPSTAGIPIVAVTASAMVEDQARIRDSGFEGYVSKPINVQEFLDTVASVLRIVSSARRARGSPASSSQGARPSMRTGAPSRRAAAKAL